MEGTNGKGSGPPDVCYLSSVTPMYQHFCQADYKFEAPHNRSPPDSIIYYRRVKLIFTRGPISFMVAFKGLNIVLGWYKCSYSLTVKRVLGAAAR